MKYSMNDYLPYISDRCTRLEIYPGREFAAKLVAEYKRSGAEVVPVHRLIPTDMNYVPNPKVIIDAIEQYARASGQIVVFVGVEAYLLFLNNREQKDFFIGVYSLLDKQKINAHILISNRFAENARATKPRYEEYMELVEFQGIDDEDSDLNIQLVPSRWIYQTENAKVLAGALEKLGDYYPSGAFCFAVDEDYYLRPGCNCVSVIRKANDALKMLYGVEADFEEAQADELLCECAAEKSIPADVLIERFGGEKYLACEKAPIRLNELKDDRLWDLYIWLLKRTLKQNTYLYHVLQRRVTAETFLHEYVVAAAKACLGDKNVKVFADERAAVLQKMNIVDPLIAKFVSETENDIRSVPFLNCGTSAETQGLIKRAAKLDDIAGGLPAVFDEANPMINYYLSPDFDYGIKALTAYFNRLRCIRIKDSIDKAFAEEAYLAEVPKGIEKRDSLLSKYDDGETALLVVDGLGAEYLPLLINVAKLNNINVAEKQIVSVNLPTSTDFNKIKWSEDHLLREERKTDNISHDGDSKHEKCSYEENLSELLVIFQKRILTRVVSGLANHRRVIVTADHGSSYPAVIAYREGMAQDIKWENPDDWRYTAVDTKRDAPEGVEAVYCPEKECSYFVVKGYNRLTKRGGKLYGLHGGATLEERLVPFVIFTNESVSEDAKEEEVEQFIENSDFDIL